ncbi:MAG: metallothionein [Gammaproteobacteria bacterium]
MTTQTHAADANTVACAHDTCQCSVAPHEQHGSHAQGQAYCSEGCANGRGCNHQGCGCAAPIALGAGA